MASNNGHESAFSVAEVVGISAAAAAALGGIVIALGRTQANASHSSLPVIESLPSRKQMKKQAQSGRKKARKAADKAVKRYPDARDYTTAVAGSGFDRAKTQSKALSTQLQDTVIPTIVERAEKIRKNVSDQAKNIDTDELADTSRHLADDAAEWLRYAGSTVSATMHDSVLPAVKPVAKDVSERAGDVYEQVRDRAEEARKRNDRFPGAKVVASGRDSAQHAMHTSTSAAKDTLSSVLWLTIASALVYLVLLSPERREQVKTAAFDAIEEIRLLIGDFKGYETEF
ncbi:hypothetical protein BH23CHL1_BH23CHL1_09200 [soil metagenome]